MDKFEMGEIAILHIALGKYAVFNETEVEVVAVGYFLNFWEGNPQICTYSIRCGDGRIADTSSYYLRKKNPPATFKGELRVLEMFTKTTAVNCGPRRSARMRLISN